MRHLPVGLEHFWTFSDWSDMISRQAFLFIIIVAIANGNGVIPESERICDIKKPYPADLEHVILNRSVAGECTVIYDVSGDRCEDERTECVDDRVIDNNTLQDPNPRLGRRHMANLVAFVDSRSDNHYFIVDMATCEWEHVRKYDIRMVVTIWTDIVHDAHNQPNIRYRLDDNFNESFIVYKEVRFTELKPRFRFPLNNPMNESLFTTCGYGEYLYWSPTSQFNTKIHLDEYGNLNVTFYGNKGHEDQNSLFRRDGYDRATGGRFLQICIQLLPNYYAYVFMAGNKWGVSARNRPRHTYPRYTPFCTDYYPRHCFSIMLYEGFNNFYALDYNPPRPFTNLVTSRIRAILGMLEMCDTPMKERFARRQRWQMENPGIEPRDCEWPRNTAIAKLI